MMEYPFEKSVLLNTAYDVLERLNCPLAYADSRAGVLRFHSGASTGEIDLTAILRDGAEVTRVEISGTEQELTGVLYDEITAALRKNYETDARRNAS